MGFQLGFQGADGDPEQQSHHLLCERPPHDCSARWLALGAEGDYEGRADTSP